MAGCGASGAQGNAPAATTAAPAADTAAETVAPAETEAPASAEETSAEATSAAETAAPAETKAPGDISLAAEISIPAAGASEYDDVSTIDFVKGLKLGWNLGNTLDATGAKSIASEMVWGQPRTTKEMIDLVKESGFTTIRIPVSWSNHVDESYQIDEAWMNRVNEIVDYAIDNDMYVILNAHHDCELTGAGYYPTEEHYEDSKVYLQAVWTQIAVHFRDYDEHVIFESMNEPRLKDTPKEWWFSPTDPDGIAAIQTIVKLNQDFVDTVRSTGGMNSKRWLMVPSHAASPDTALNDAFEMPSDPAERLIVSIHAYSPYDFAMNENGYNTWDGSHDGELADMMNKLDGKFIQNGYGVVIGEFGCTNKDNIEDRIAWADTYTKAAAEHGISCVWWDNGGTKVGAENFGMIDRRELSVFYPEILDVMKNNLG